MSQKILVVDDVPDIVSLMTFTLESEGYQVLSAEDGEGGVELAKKELPDLIFLDVMMPLKSGFDVCKELKQDPKTSRIPIIILSVRASDADIEKGMKAGADDYITKPFDPMKLIEKVTKILGRKV